MQRVTILVRPSQASSRRSTRTRYCSVSTIAQDYFHLRTVAILLLDEKRWSCRYAAILDGMRTPRRSAFLWVVV